MREVWIAQHQGFEHGSVCGVFADRDSAMAWLRLQHQLAWQDAAATDAFWRKEYAERAAEEADPEIRAYYEEKARKPDVRRVSEITEGNGIASFGKGEYDRYLVSTYEVKTFTPPGGTDD